MKPNKLWIRQCSEPSVILITAGVLARAVRHPSQATPIECLGTAGVYYRT